MEIRSVNLTLQLGSVLRRALDDEAYAKAYDLLEKVALFDANPVVSTEEAAIFTETFNSTCFGGAAISFTAEDVAAAEKYLRETLLSDKKYEFIAAANTAMNGQDYDTCKAGFDRITTLYKNNGLDTEQKQQVDWMALHALQDQDSEIRWRGLMFSHSLKLRFVLRELVFMWPFQERSKAEKEPLYEGGPPIYMVNAAKKEMNSNNLAQIPDTVAWILGEKDPANNDVQINSLMRRALNITATMPSAAWRVEGLLIEDAQVFRGAYEWFLNINGPDLQTRCFSVILREAALNDQDPKLVAAEFQYVQDAVQETIQEEQQKPRTDALSRTTGISNVGAMNDQAPPVIKATNTSVLLSAGTFLSNNVSANSNDQVVRPAIIFTGEMLDRISQKTAEKRKNDELLLMLDKLLSEDISVKEKEKLLGQLKGRADLSRARVVLIRCLERNKNTITLAGALIDILADLNDRRAIPVLIECLWYPNINQKAVQALLKLKALRALGAIRKVSELGTLSNGSPLFDNAVTQLEALEEQLRKSAGR